MSTTVHVFGNVAQQPELMEIQTRKGPTHKLQICIASNPVHASESLCATFTDCEIWAKGLQLWQIMWAKVTGYTL